MKASPELPTRRATGGPEVSVVVIFKDADDFLEEAIGSVLAQTFTAWELLLVDDGSTDASTAIAKRHAQQAPDRISYLEHPRHSNRGMSATRNLGIARARGEFLIFLDADDVLVPTALEEQAAVLRTHPRVGMVYGPLEYWYGWTGRPEDAARDFVHPVGVRTERIYEPPSLIALFIQNIAFAPSGMLLRRALVERVGGYEESFRDLYEDQVFAAKVCRTTPVYISGRCSYRYRQHENSCCLKAEREGRLGASREPFLRWLLAYLEEEGLAGGDAWRRVRVELGLQPPSPRDRLSAARTLVRRRLAGIVGGVAARWRKRPLSPAPEPADGDPREAARRTGRA
jgi:glycosyltransferase involved in cell wall biosynthesis